MARPPGFGQHLPTTARTVMRLSTAIAALLLVPAVACPAQDMGVKVERRGETVIVDVEATAPGPLADAWAVLTDYDHMASFISNLTASRIVEHRDRDTLHVMQAGQTKVAFMTFGFEAVRAVELVPMREIRSSFVSGDFKSYTSTTSISTVPSGTRIVHHGEYVPKKWLPPMIGPAVIERETRRQYQEFIAEIERRSAAKR
jgi:ribosome-associated toxin RatA of RatAB toxin-antitoxin module